MADTTTSSSSAPGPAAMSPRSAPRSSGSRPRSSSASCSAASASTGGASRPRRCCARPRSSTTSSTPTPTASATRSRRSTSPRSSRAAARVAKQLNQGVAHLMKKNKITVVMGEGKLTGKGKLVGHGRGRQDDRARRQAHHRRDRRAGARPAVRQGRRQAHLDLPPRDDPARNADRAAGHRLGRDRDRVRQLLCRPRRQGDGGRDARPRRPGRGRRGQRPARQEPDRSRA